MEVTLRLSTPADIRRFTAGLNTNDRAMCQSCANLVTIGLGAWSKNCRSSEWFVSDEMIIEEPYNTPGNGKCTGYIRSGN